MKIAIPKALTAYQYPILYEHFFKLLGIEVVYSDHTNQEIVQEGIQYSIDECCLATKIYMGHIANLVKRVQTENISYIFAPRISFWGKRETVCVKFYAMYDICKTMFPEIPFVTLNIDYKKGNQEAKAFIALGMQLGFSYAQSLASYLKARNRQRMYEQKKYQKQLASLELHNKNVLLVSHPYIAYDAFLGAPIIRYLESCGIGVCYANHNQMQAKKMVSLKKKEPYEKITPSLYWRESRELLNGLVEYLPKVDGIIYLSTFPCGPDALVNELVLRKVKEKPSIHLILDEQEAGEGLYTRLESFVDIISQEEEKVSGESYGE